MTKNEQKFVLEFVTRANARQAYLAAGYSCTPEAAAVAAHRLLRRDDIVAAAPPGSPARAWLASPARSRPIARCVALVDAIPSPEDRPLREFINRYHPEVCHVS